MKLDENPNAQTNSIPRSSSGTEWQGQQRAREGARNCPFPIWFHFHAYLSSLPNAINTEGIKSHCIISHHNKRAFWLQSAVKWWNNETNFTQEVPWWDSAPRTTRALISGTGGVMLLFWRSTHGGSWRPDLNDEVSHGALASMLDDSQVYSFPLRRRNGLEDFLKTWAPASLPSFTVLLSPGDIAPPCQPYSPTVPILLLQSEPNTSRAPCAKSRIDPTISSWLFLVKWFLSLSPHHLSVYENH